MRVPRLGMGVGVLGYGVRGSRRACGSGSGGLAGWGGRSSLGSVSRCPPGASPVVVLVS